MTGWGEVLKLLFGLLPDLVAWLRDRSLTNRQRVRDRMTALQGRLDEIDAAMEKRDALHLYNDLGGDGPKPA